jgi:glycosyltransferase involved in cell wall biosynthesis
MNVSIVIPVYNEAERLAACLEAIALQTVKPLEVLVIDNNSTDETARIAESFPFVTLLREKRQGVVHARKLGFNATHADIIGRVDADTILPPHWIADVIELFKDQSVAALSGSAHYYDFALPAVADKIDGILRKRLARQLGNQNYLWGANMAIRRSAWLKVRSHLCTAKALHEDFDIGIHLQAMDLKVTYEPTLKASVSSRRVDSNFLDYFRYSMVSPYTYKKHGLSSRRHMYKVLLVCWMAYLPARVLYRGYNPETGTFSLGRAFLPTEARIDPTTNTI